jgi:5-methyltetrahydrofolate--homocysteine methyltransferase
MSDILNEIVARVYAGDEEEVTQLLRTGLEQGIDPLTLLNKGLLAGMDRVGNDFKSGVLYVPEVLIAARSMQAGMNILRPLLSDAKNISVGKVVIGTVKGDLHDIGKNLVKMMLEGAGFVVIDLGNNVSAQGFVDAVRAHSPDLVGLSALLTTTMPHMKETISALIASGFRDSIKVMIGGAPVTSDYATQIGADAYAQDAAVAVEKARNLVAGM